MSERAPGWVWFALGATVVGGAAGLAWWSARSPSWDNLVRRTGAPRELAKFAALQRYTESRDNPKAGLGRPELFPWWAEPRRSAGKAEQDQESAAALEAYERNAASYGESPYRKPAWVFGSGGAYGLIPANALASFRDSDPLRRGTVGPYDVFDPWKSTVLFADYVYRLIHRDEFAELPSVARNWLAVKRGLASPSLMADHAETKERSRTVRQRADEAAEAVGLDPAFLRDRVPNVWPDFPGAVELLG
ncbi:hypothetical protein ACNOYE_34755 [Nannocystaceae bacterium ST9]